MRLRSYYAEIFRYVLSAQILPGRDDELRASLLLGCVYAVPATITLVLFMDIPDFAITKTEVLLSALFFGGTPAGIIFVLFRDVRAVDGSLPRLRDISIRAAGVFVASILLVVASASGLAFVLRG